MTKQEAKPMGRPNTMYAEILEGVPRDGEWYEVKRFRGRESASRAKGILERGERPLPGGVGKWEFSAEIAKGESVLWGRWIG